MRKITGKPYRCTVCDTRVDLSTNHHGECYPHCRTCRTTTPHEFVGEKPEGAWVPEKWKIVKLGDVAEIVS